MAHRMSPYIDLEGAFGADIADELATKGKATPRHNDAPSFPEYARSTQEEPRLRAFVIAACFRILEFSSGSPYFCRT